MSRGWVWGWIGRVLLAGSLTAVVFWPAIATVMEATGVNAALVRWRGIESEEPSSDVSSALDPAGTSSVIADDRGLSRPARLAIETTRLVLATEAMVMPAGVLLAMLLFRTDIWGRRALLAVLALSAFVPMPLHAAAWLGALGNAGRMQALGLNPILVGPFGAAVVHAIAALPWVVLVAGVGISAVEPELEELALLEFGPIRVTARVTLRRAIGALAAAAVAVAVLTAGDMTVTDLLQVRTYAEEAYVQFILGRGLADAAVVALPPLIVLGVGIILASRAFGRLEASRLASTAETRIWGLGRWRVPVGLTFLLLVGNAMAFPLYALMWRAGRVGGRAMIGRPPEWSLSGLIGTLHLAAGEIRDPLASSLLWGSIAATLATAMAFGLAWTGRTSRPWRWAMLAAMSIALATPGPVAGRALMLAYIGFPNLYDSSWMLVLAQAMRAIPYAILIVWPFVRMFPQDHLDAAALDGYGPAGQLTRVVLPSSGKALVASWMVSIALAIGELPATRQVYPPGIEPMSVFLWGLLHTGVESHLAGVALLMLAAIITMGLAAALAIRWARAADLR